MPAGSLIALVLFDVAEQIDLDLVRKAVAAEPPRREPSFKHPAPEYVRFENPPVVENHGPVSVAESPRWECRVKYFDYGVVSAELKLDFNLSWDDLVRLSNRWINAPEIEQQTTGLVRSRLERLSKALIQPYGSWLSEDYYVIHLQDAREVGAPSLSTSGAVSASRLMVDRGAEIAQIVRGESVRLGEGERTEALQASLSYYANDLLVAGWVAALVYDSPEGAAPAIQLLEYANTQLLEFRHYDDLLTRVLAEVYRIIERRAGILRPWRLAREAKRLNAMRLEVTELTERADNAIKFLSDMYYARAYRMASARVGVTDYRTLVERKLRTAADLYEAMMNEFRQGRSFVLEAMVVLILVIELIHLFRSGL
jgi:hypothetical protein